MELCISWPKLAWQKWSLIWKQKKRGPVTISSTTLPRTTERKEEILTWRESSRSGLKEEKPVGLCKALDYQESEALNALLRKMTAQWLIRNLVWNKTLDCFPFSCNSLLCFHCALFSYAFRSLSEPKVLQSNRWDPPPSSFQSEAGQ